MNPRDDSPSGLDNVENGERELRPDKHPSTLPIDQLMLVCRLSQTRRGGPGGQHRNKTESAIVILHEPTGVLGQASERRSQHQNRTVAIQRLRINLALAVRANPEALATSSELWNRRSKTGRIEINPDHEEFPAILAELLDVLAIENWDLEAVSLRLKVSKSQLIKLLKKEPTAFQWLNRKRQEQGLFPLK